jgi:hypothetical protein
MADPPHASQKQPDETSNHEQPDQRAHTFSAFPVSLARQPLLPTHRATHYRITQAPLLFRDDQRLNVAEISAGEWHRL